MCQRDRGEGKRESYRLFINFPNHQDDEKLSYVDCVVMPKLQHIRVTMEEFKQTNIPHDLLHLWSYYDTMYQSEEFTTTVAQDNDLYLHYQDKVEPRPEKKYLLVKQLTKTLTIPSSVKSKISALHKTQEGDS